MSGVADVIEGQLGRRLRSTGMVNGPFRGANVIALTAPAQGIIPLAAAPMTRGRALYLENIYGWMRIDTATRPTIQGITLFLEDSAGGILCALGEPIVTTVTSVSGLTILFPQVPLITFEDVLATAVAFGGDPTLQPWQIHLTIDQSASTGTVRWGCKYWLAMGVDDG